MQNFHKLLIVPMVLSSVAVVMMCRDYDSQSLTILDEVFKDFNGGYLQAMDDVTLSDSFKSSSDRFTTLYPDARLYAVSGIATPALQTVLDDLDL